MQPQVDIDTADLDTLWAMPRDQVAALPVARRRARVARLRVDERPWDVPRLLVVFGVPRNTFDRWRARSRDDATLAAWQRMPDPLPPVPGRPGRPKLYFRAGDMLRWGRWTDRLDVDLHPRQQRDYA